jgi:thiol-disulfide isomerase/thioredoxin
MIRLLSSHAFLLGYFSLFILTFSSLALQPVTRSFSSSTTQRFYRSPFETASTSSPPSIAEIRAATSSLPNQSLPVHTLEDFARIIQQCQEANEIAMVFWSASWCRSCHRLQPQIQQLIQRSKDRPIRFLHIANPQYSLSTKPSSLSSSSSEQQRTNPQMLHALFGIRTVPFCHIYHPIYGLVEERKLTPSSPTNKSSSTLRNTAISVAQLDRIPQSYIQGYCCLEEEDGTPAAPRN